MAVVSPGRVALGAVEPGPEPHVIASVIEAADKDARFVLAPGIPERAPEEAVLRVQVVQRRRPLDNLIGLFHGYASLLVLDAAGSVGVGLDALGGSLLGGRGDIGG